MLADGRHGTDPENYDSVNHPWARKTGSGGDVNVSPSTRSERGDFFINIH